MSAHVCAYSSQILNVSKSGREFTVLKTSNFSEGDRVYVLHPKTGKKVTAEVRECRKTSCLLELDSDPDVVLASGMRVTKYKKKRRFAAVVSVDNALGPTYGGAFYYNFPKAPWMAGVKFRQVDNKTNDIDLSGQIFSFEVQRYLWSRSRFQLWGTSEIGMMKINMDFSKITPGEEELNETEYFVTLGIEGRYNLTENFRLIAGVGMLYSTLDDSYQTSSNSYDLDISTFYGMAKLGLAYFF